MNELDALSRSLLSAAGNCHEPTEADRIRIRARLAKCLGITVGLGAVASAATHASPAAAATATGAVAEGSLVGTLFGSAKLLVVGKVVGITLAATAAGFGGYEWASSSDSATRTATPADVTPAPPVSATTVVKTPDAVELPDAPDFTTASATQRRFPKPPEAPLPRTAGNAATANTPSVQPGASSGSQADPREVALPAVASFPVDQPNLSSETRALQRAQEILLEGLAAQALLLLEQQKAEFSGGLLDEERSAARVVALCRMGRVQAANAAAAEFLKKAPHSVLAERVANACSNQK